MAWVIGFRFWGSCATMGSFCCKRRAKEVLEPEVLVGPIPTAPRYDDEGFCLTPVNGWNRRPVTHEFAQQ